MRQGWRGQHRGFPSCPSTHLPLHHHPTPPLRYEKYVLTRDENHGGVDAFAAAHADVLVKVAALAAKADEAAAAGDRATRAALNAEIRCVLCGGGGVSGARARPAQREG